MLLKLFILVCVGLGAVGILLLAAHLTRWKSGKKFAPLVAAIAVLSYESWSRYSWSDRIVAGLPAQSEIVERYPYQGLLEPWTKWFPRVGSVLVLDHAATMTNPEHPSFRLIRTELWEQDMDTLELRHVVDCARGRRALASTIIAGSGAPPDDAWIVEPDAPLVKAACR